MQPTLPKSHKRHYPFRLATTSFIYPADYATNAERLGPYLDEVELLLFESRPDALPSTAEIERLAKIAERFDLRYNVHLPYDISLCAPDDDRRRQAAATLGHIIEITSPLSPVSHTLHLPWTGGPRATWLPWAEDGIARLLDLGVAGRSLSVETLDYPFEWLDDLLESRDLSVCLDLGHLMVHGVDPAAAMDRYQQRTAVVHFHGVAGRADHLPLGRLAPEAARPILERLRRFRGSVSIEVFAFDDLAASMETLAAWWMRFSPVTAEKPAAKA